MFYFSSSCSTNNSTLDTVVSIPSFKKAAVLHFFKKRGEDPSNCPLKAIVSLDLGGLLAGWILVGSIGRSSRSSDAALEHFGAQDDHDITFLRGKRSSAAVGWSLLSRTFVPHTLLFIPNGLDSGLLYNLIVLRPRLALFVVAAHPPTLLLLLVVLVVVVLLLGVVLLLLAHDVAFVA